MQARTGGNGSPNFLVVGQPRRMMLVGLERVISGESKEKRACVLFNHEYSDCYLTP